MTSARQSLWQRLSIVWIVPFLALVIVLGVAWTSFAERGPLIGITFKNATGIRSGETELRYRDVTVGLVEKVAFSAGLESVLVSVRLDKDVAEYVDENALFWVERPRVTTQGVTGLDTVLTGVFIEGFWDSEAGGLVTRFDGLADPPIDRHGEDGLQILLRASAGVSLVEDAPILYRGVTVGRVGRAAIASDGTTAEAQAIIFEPHDRLITSSTRFWDTSGFSFSLGPSGANLNFSSLASLVSGGLTFGTLVSGGEPVSLGATYTVFADEGDARASLFAEEEGETLNIAAIFQDNVAGLSVDAPVQLNGLQIGRVSAINGIVDPDRFGDNRVRLVASMVIRPNRLGLEGEAGPDTALDFLKGRVRDGVRARLATASILTGGLKVEFIEVPDAPPAEIDETSGPTPLMPTTESDIADVSATAEGVFQRINALPIEELLANANELLANANALITSEDTRSIPDNVNSLLADARNVISSEEVQALPEQLNSVVTQLDALVTEINEQKLTAELKAAVESASTAADGVATAVEGIPDLVERMNAVVANAEKVDLEKVSGELTELLESADAILAGEAARNLPERLTGTLEELRAILSDLRERGVPENAAATLASAREAAEGVSAAAEGVPELIDRMNAVVGKAEEVELDKMAAELTALLESADEILGTEDAKNLPKSLNSALDELRAVLAELREGNVAENTVEALSSAREVADTFAKAGEDLPGLIDRANRVLAQASATLQGYQANDGVGRDAREALREVQRAAQAVSQLARTLQRNPNSLLIGR